MVLFRADEQCIENRLFFFRWKFLTSRVCVICKDSEFCDFIIIMRILICSFWRCACVI